MTAPWSPLGRLRASPATPPLDLQQWLQKAKEASSSHPMPLDSRARLAGRLHLILVRLLGDLSTPFQFLVSWHVKQSCRRETERLLLWGQGFTSERGKLDDILDGSPDLRANVVALLYQIGNNVVRCKSIGIAVALGSIFASRTDFSTPLKIHY